MQITENKVIAIDYKLTDDQGELIDQSEASDPLYYLHGAGQIIPGLEEELEGKSQGDSFTVTIDAENAYGTREEELVRSIPKDMFEDAEMLEVGLQFELEDDEGVYLFTITEVNEDDVVADGNHDLAGMRLTFEVKVGEVRDATEEELEHGHAHYPGMESH